MTTPLDETAQHTELAPTQQDLFIEGELRLALQHLAVAAAFIDVDGIEGVPNHEVLSAELIKKIGAISGSMITIETIEPETAPDVADHVGPPQATVPLAVPAAEATIADETDANNTSGVDTGASTTQTPEAESPEPAPEHHADDESPATIPIVDEQEPIEVRLADDQTEIVEADNTTDNDPLAVITNKAGLSPREVEITRAILDIATPDTWFQQKGIDLSQVDFASESARRQAFSKLTLRLIGAGILEAEGIKGGRKYKFTNTSESPTTTVVADEPAPAVLEQPELLTPQSTDQEATPPAPETMIFIRSKNIRIGKDYYELKHGESRYLTAVKNAGQLVSAKSLVESLHGPEKAAEDAVLLDDAEDVLMDLHKRGILNEEVEFLEDDEIPRYTINTDIAVTLASKQRVYVGDTELYLDDFDKGVLRLVYESSRPLEVAEIARRVGAPGEPLPKPEFDRLVRTLKKYFISQGIMHKKSGKRDKQFKPAYAINDDQITNVGKALARLA